MNWLFVAFLAQFILGTSALADKLLLKKLYPNPVGYTFWLGVLGLASIILLPFGYQGIPQNVLLYAFAAGAVFIIGMLFYFFALFSGKTAAAIIATAGFTPLTTLLFGSWFLGTAIAPYQITSFVFLVAGGLLLAWPEGEGLRRKTLFYSLFAAIGLGASNIFSKFVFDETNFVTGFFWIKVGSALAASAFLLYPVWKKRILKPHPTEAFRGKAGYLSNRAYAGVGSILVFYALSLGVPPLVSATESIRFLIVLAGGWFLLHEKVRLRAVLAELGAFALIAVAVITLGVGDYLGSTKPDPDRPIKWGVTFSQKFASEFGMPWQDIYLAIFDDLGAKRVRVVGYWDLLESEQGKYDFSDLDYQMDIAREKNASVILAVGQKAPRWPECHIPSWAASLGEAKRQQMFEKFLGEAVTRYRTHQALQMWQVENEPFLRFGDCGARDTKAVDSELALVKKLDSLHPILVTDSGELGLWVRAAKRGDAFGTTMYRRVYNRVFGYVDYHLPPGFFRLKEAIVRTFIGDSTKPFLVVELAAEPWIPRRLADTTPDETKEFFDEEFFKDTIRYANAAGFDEYYLWGVEWWWWQGKKYGNWGYWEIAKELFL